MCVYKIFLNGSDPDTDDSDDEQQQPTQPQQASR
jgi:hypothetical protein